jgi:TrkA family protein
MTNARQSRRRQSLSILFRPVLWQVVLPVALVLATVGTGTIGFKRYYEVNAQLLARSGGSAESVTWGHAFFQAVGLPLLESTSQVEPGCIVPTSLQAGRVLGLLVPPYAFFLVIAVAFRGPVGLLRILRWRLTPWNKYAVVCGLGWMGRELANDLLSAGYKIVGIDAPAAVRAAHSLRGRGVVILHEDAASTDVLSRAGAVHADRVYVMTGDDETNCRIVRLLASLLSPDAAKTSEESSLHCFVQVQDARKRRLLCDTMREGALNVTCFDIYETTARRLFARRPICRFSQSRTAARVVIMGNTPPAQAVLLQTLRTGQFLPGQSLHVSVIAPDAQSCRDDFYRRHPFYVPGSQSEDALQRLHEQIVPRIEFIELPGSDAGLLDDEFELYAGISPDTALSVYVCLDDGLESAAQIAAFRRKLEVLAEDRDGDVQVFYYYNCPEDEPAPPLLGSAGEDAGVLVESFGDFIEECSVQAIEGQSLDDLARALSEHYAREWPDKETEQALAEMTEADIRRFFQKQWHATEEWKRESNRQAADHIPVKLLCIGVPAAPGPDGVLQFDIGEVEACLAEEDTKRVVAEMEHRRWCAERILSGWIPLLASDPRHATWGLQKRRLQVQKLHVDFVPFDDLPEGEKTKDYSQIEAIPKFLRKTQGDKSRPS